MQVVLPCPSATATLAGLPCTSALMAEEIFSSALNDFTRAAPPIITMPGSISAISATLSTRDRSPYSKITTFSLLVSLNFSASFCAPWKSRNGCTTVTLIFRPSDICTLPAA